MSQSREYSCADLPMLQSRIIKNSKDNAASVAAMTIRFMGRNSNSCVKNITETDNAVAIEYTDHGSVAADVFNFSKANQLVSMLRTWADGSVETTNF